MKLLLKKATVINPLGAFHLQEVDILLEQGKIVAIDGEIQSNNAQKISYDNLHISPGWFDSSVCFGEPGYEERETLQHGLKVAASSGFTAIALEPNANPVVDSQSSIIHLKQVGQLHATQIHPIATFTKQQKGKQLTEMYDLHQHGAIGFGDFAQSIKNAEILRTGLLYAQRFNGLILSTPADPYLGAKGVAHEGKISTSLGLSGTPNLNEILQLQRDIEILSYTGGKLHIPCISTHEGVELIRSAKKRGLKLSCSVALANLLLNEESLNGFNTNYKLLPPLRSKKDQEALKEGLLDGTINMVTSHHQPLNLELKHTEFEHAMSGTIGLEAMFGMLNTLFPLEKTIQILLRGRTSFGLPKPKIEIGNYVDLSLFNPEGTQLFTNEQLLSTSKNSAFLGLPFRGKVYGVIRNEFVQLQ